MTKYFSSRELSCDTAGSGSDAAPSAIHAPLVRPGPMRSATACLLSSPTSTARTSARRRSRCSAGMPCTSATASDEHRRGLEEHHRLTGDRRHRDQRADAGERRGRADGGAAGHHRGEVVLLELADDLGGRRVGIVLAEPVDVGLDGGGLHAGPALDDLRQRARCRARVRRRRLQATELLALERALMSSASLCVRRLSGYVASQRSPVVAGCPEVTAVTQGCPIARLGKKILLRGANNFHGIIATRGPQERRHRGSRNPVGTDPAPSRTADDRGARPAGRAGSADHRHVPACAAAASPTSSRCRRRWCS